MKIFAESFVNLRSLLQVYLLLLQGLRPTALLSLAALPTAERQTLARR